MELKELASYVEEHKDATGSTVAEERISTNDLFVCLGGKSEMIRQLTMLKETIIPSPSSSSVPHLPHHRHHRRRHRQDG